MTEIPWNVANDYFAERFVEVGSGTLSHLCAKRIPLSEGRFFAVCIGGVSEGRLRELRTGGLAIAADPESRLDASRPPVALLAETLNRDGQSAVGEFLLMEDAAMRVGDPVPEEWTGFLRVYEDEVYHGLGLANASESLVEDALRRSNTAWRHFGLVVTGCGLENRDAGDPVALQKHDLDCAATRAHAIFMDAYDHEGYVVWLRQLPA